MNRASAAIAAAVALLFSMGLLMVFNTTSAEILDRALNEDTHWALYKQMGYGVAGLGFALLAMHLGYEFFIRWSTPLLIGVTLLLVLVFVPGIGQTLNGARRWLGLFGVTFQPSECLKIIFPAYYIYWINKNRDLSLRSFLVLLGWLLIPLGLVLLEPDNGTTAILLALLVALFFLSQVRWRYWALPLLVVAGLGLGAASQMPHVMTRLRVFLHPEADLLGKGHQPHQAKIAAGSGRLLGRGLGESVQKLNYLPEARSDYIAAIYAEETGFIGILFLILLYMGISCSGFWIALQARDSMGYFFAATITFLIALESFLNLGVVSGLLPSKGMTLPFFSQGGSSLVVHLVAVGLLLDISRKGARSCVF